MTTSTLPIFFTNDPFVCIVHNSDSLSVLSLGKVNSAMKLANTWAFMLVQSLYSMSNWLNSTAHNTIRLVAASGLFIAFFIG